MKMLSNLSFLIFFWCFLWLKFLFLPFVLIKGMIKGLIETVSDIAYPYKNPIKELIHFISFMLFPFIVIPLRLIKFHKEKKVFSWMELIKKIRNPMYKK